MTRAEFIDKAWHAATEAREYGAPISVPIAVAQAALETNFGASDLSSKHNNLFGIKGEYRGNYVDYQTKEQDPEGHVSIVTARFKSYPSWAKCFEDYGNIVARLPWYEDAEDAANVPRDYLKGLVAIRSEEGDVIEPGWATDVDYFEKVWSIAERHYLLQRPEVSEEDELGLVIIYDGSKKLCYKPQKHTLGMTNDGKPKLMIRVSPTTFWQRLRYLFGGR